MEQKKHALFTDISGYVLALGEAGWDVSENIGRKQAPRGTLLNAIKFCIRECDKDVNCAGFTLFMGICWPKDVKMMNQEYEFSGKTSLGWRWLYRSKSKTGVRDCALMWTHLAHTECKGTRHTLYPWKPLSHCRCSCCESIG